MNKITSTKEIIDMNYIVEVLDLLVKDFEKEQNNDFWKQVWLWLSLNPNESARIILKYCVWESITISLLNKGVMHKDLIIYRKIFDVLYVRTYEIKIGMLFEKYIQKVVIIK